MLFSGVVTGCEGQEKGEQAYRCPDHTPEPVCTHVQTRTRRSTRCRRSSSPLFFTRERPPERRGAAPQTPTSRTRAPCPQQPPRAGLCHLRPLRPRQAAAAASLTWAPGPTGACSGSNSRALSSGRGRRPEASPPGRPRERRAPLPPPWSQAHTYLILLKTMSTSVTVTFLPSITWQSLHSLDQFLPCISFPVALVSPCTANLRKASSRALSSGPAAAAPSLAPSDSGDSLLAALSFAGSPGDLGGVLLAGLGGLGLLSAMLLGGSNKRSPASAGSCPRPPLPTDRGCGPPATVRPRDKVSICCRTRRGPSSPGTLAAKSPTVKASSAGEHEASLLGHSGPLLLWGLPE